MKNIYLCGFMGCGKTTVGRMAARFMELPFVDLDRFIEAKQGKPIADIFGGEGEEAFRRAETACLRELSDTGGQVISLGGGTMLNPENAAIAQKNGVICLLECPFESCWERIEHSARPLVASHTKEEIYELYLKRRAVYRRFAGLAVCVSNQPPTTATHLIQRLRDRDDLPRSWFSSKEPDPADLADTVSPADSDDLADLASSLEQL